MKFCLNDLPVASVIKEGQYALFMSLKAEEKREIEYSTKLYDNLNFELWCNKFPIKPNNLENDIPSLFNRPTSFSLLLNILSMLKKMYENEAQKMAGGND